MGCVSFNCEKFYDCKHVWDDGASVDWANMSFGKVDEYGGEVEYYCGECGNYAKFEQIDDGIYKNMDNLIFSGGYNDVFPQASPCLICGEFVLADNPTVVCDKCRKAVMRVRKATDEELDHFISLKGVFLDKNRSEMSENDKKSVGKRISEAVKRTKKYKKE